MKTKVETAKAPSAIGPYSQAIRSHETVYLSGQIPLDPKTMQLVTGDIAAQTQQVMKNLQAVCEEASGSLNAIVKLTIFLTDFAHFATVNDVMMQFFQLPYPARSTIQVAALPKEAQIEIEGVMVLNHNA